MSAFARNNFSHATYNASDQQSNSSHACSSGYFDCSLCVTAEMGFDGVMSVSHACLYQACVVSSVSELECRSSVSVLPCLSGVPRAGAQIQPRRALGSKDYGKRTVKICASDSRYVSLTAMSIRESAYGSSSARSSIMERCQDLKALNQTIAGQAGAGGGQ